MADCTSKEQVAKIKSLYMSYILLILIVKSLIEKRHSIHLLLPGRGRRHRCRRLRRRGRGATVRLEGPRSELWLRPDDDKVADQVRVHHQDGGAVVEDVAVVGRRENGDQLAVGEELVAVLDDLVGAHNQIEVVLHQEALHDVAPEGVADAPIVGRPGAGGLVGIRPEQVAEQPLAGHLCGPMQAPDVVQVLQVRTQAAVDAEDAIAHNGGHRHAVVAVHEGLPQLHAVPPLALVVEPIDPVHVRGLVVAAQHEEALRVADLVGQQQGQGLYGVLSPIHVVAQEQVVGQRRRAALLEDPKQILVLAVQIPAYLHRRTQLQEHRLGEEQIPGRAAHEDDGGLWQVGRPAVDITLRLQLVYDGVQVPQSGPLLLFPLLLGLGVAGARDTRGATVRHGFLVF